MKCQSERMSVSIRSLTVLRVLRTMEKRGLAFMQIMLHFSWSVVCIESGSNQLLTTSYVAALRLTSWRCSWRMPGCWPACCHCMWHGCQQCQGFETVGCYQTEAILQVSEPRDCDCVWSSTPPEVHQEPFPQIWCAVWVWAHAQPAACHCKVGTHLYMLKVVNNTTRYKKNVYSRY